MKIQPILALCLALWLGSAVAAPALTQSAEPVRPTPSWAQSIDPSANLFAVSPMLYRSHQLQAADVAVLQRLGVRTVVNLRYFDRDDDAQVLGQSGVKLVSVPIVTWRIRPGDVAAALWAIEQHQAEGPVLVHCYHGADRTGLVVGMYRIIYQGWSIEAAKQEMEQGPYGFHRMWRNVSGYYSDAKVAQVRQELDRLRARDQGLASKDAAVTVRP